MCIKEIQDDFNPLHKKVFARWVNEKIKSNDQLIDISNEQILTKLAQVLTKSDKILPTENEQKQNIIQSIIEIFENDGVKFDQLSIENMNENCEKFIEKVIWNLISHYSINRSLSSTELNINDNEINQKNEKNNFVKENLLSWAKKRISNYPYVYNFEPYELFLCALLDSYVPDKINYKALNPKDSENNMKLALSVMKYLGIPIYIYQEDITNKIDEKVLLTQLSSLKIVMNVQESMSHTLSISNSDYEDEKSLQTSDNSSNTFTDNSSNTFTDNSSNTFTDNSSNTFVEFDYDSFSQSESLEKLSPRNQLMNHDPSLLTLSNKESIYNSLTNALSETQKVSQRQIEKLMASVESLTQQLMESKVQVGQLTKKEKIDQETIKNLMNKLENSQPQTNNQSKIDELNSQIDILKKEIMNSDILKNELKMKLTETENNDKKTIEYLKQQLNESENKMNKLTQIISENEKKNQEKLNDLQQKLSDSQNEVNELSLKLSNVDHINQEKINELKKKLNNSEKEKNEFTQKGKINQETNNELLQKLTNSENKLNELTKKLSEIDQIKQKKIDELNQKIKESENQINELTEKLSKTEDNDKEEIENLKQQLNESESKVNELTTNNEKDETIDDLKQKLEESENQINELVTKLSKTENNDKETIDNLKEKLVESENKSNELTTKLSEIDQINQIIINELNQKIKETENQINELTTKLSETESNNNKTIDSLNQKLRESSNQINELTTKLSKTENNYNETVDNLKQKLVETENKNNELNTKLSTIESNNKDTVDNLKQKLKELSTKLSNADNNNETIDKLKQKLEESENKVNELTTKLAESKTKTQELITKLNKTEEDNQETIECFKQKLAKTLDINKSLIEQLSSENTEIKLSQSSSENQSNNSSQITEENDHSNESELRQKLEETETNYNIVSKQLSEVQISMRKALFDSEMKTQTLSLKFHQEIEDLNEEKNRLIKELEIAKSKEIFLTNELDKTKKNAEVEINHLMVALSDSENKCIQFYDKNQAEIDSLKKELKESKEQTISAQSDFEQMKKAFSDSQARLCQLYEKIYHAN